MAELERPLDPERDRWFLGTLDSIVAKTSETGGAYSILLRVAPRGFSPPHHLHSRETTGFLVLDGRVLLRVGDEEVVLGPNEFRLGPKGVPHWFRVESETARFLEILTPGGFEQFHLDVSVPAERFEIPPSDVPKATPEEVKAASARHGTTVLGPHPPDKR